MVIVAVVENEIMEHSPLLSWLQYNVHIRLQTFWPSKHLTNLIQMQLKIQMLLIFDTDAVSVVFMEEFYALRNMSFHFYFCYANELFLTLESQSEQALGKLVIHFFFLVERVP